MGFGCGDRCSTKCYKGAADGKKIAGGEVLRRLVNKWHDMPQEYLGFHLGAEKGGLG
jgi:hypothetical protein